MKLELTSLYLFPREYPAATYLLPFEDGRLERKIVEALRAFPKIANPMKTLGITAHGMTIVILSPRPAEGTPGSVETPFMFRTDAPEYLAVLEILKEEGLTILETSAPGAPRQARPGEASGLPGFRIDRKYISG